MFGPLIDRKFGCLAGIGQNLCEEGEWNPRPSRGAIRRAHRGKSHRDCIAAKPEESIRRLKVGLGFCGGIDFVGVEARPWWFRQVPDQSDLVERDHSHCRGRDHPAADNSTTLSEIQASPGAQLNTQFLRSHHS